MGSFKGNLVFLLNQAYICNSLNVYCNSLKIKKNDIISAIESIKIAGESKSIVENNSIQNIVIFGDEVLIDISISNPALQARKRTEAEIKKAIHNLVYSKAKIKVNFNLEKVNLEKPEIKGKEIPGVKNIIAVASGKGGVGKSTITSNIAVTLSKMGFNVGVLDADIYGPSIPIMFDVADQKPSAVKVGNSSKMKPVENYGVKILSIGFFTKPNQAVIWRGPMAAKALNQMIFDVDWGVLDFLLVDLPPGTGDIHLSTVQALPITGAIVVSTPQNVALADARKGVAMFNQESINVPVLGIVENMAYFIPDELPNSKYYIFGQQGAKNLAFDLDVAFLGEVPLVQSLRESGDFGRPAALQENTALEDAFMKLTQKMVTELVKRNKNIPPTEVVKITTMAGCNAINK